ncbi:MAG: chemotaxis response regulator protein-glutamate methylesterase [Oscillospiraceae bacterium]|nr:chemotaxis response regulator protein-glutamate methylesterase [Oscillospiraceae bacterium]
MIAAKKTRVLVVDDSVLFRTTLAKRLETDQNLEVIATASDAMDAMNKIQQLHPDVVTLDVEMPKMSGIEFLKKLMPTHPLPVVVVSSAPITALDALDAGAVDFVKKPQVSSPQDLDMFIRDLITKIKIASVARVGQRKPLVKAPVLNKTGASSLVRPVDNMVIAIGASTGGTEAILEVVKELPATTPGIVIVQHMPPVFTRMYAERLNKICKMRVKEAEDGDRVEQGKIIIGAGEFHLRLAKDSQGYYVRSQRGEKVSGHCPSVDVLFDSVATVAKGRAMGVILTGMGADGAKGLLAMRKAGAYTVGQDKESCVVYGMPMVAFNIGGVTKQFPLDRIGDEIIRHLNTIK